MFIFGQKNMVKRILLGHGSGGIMTADLIKNVFLKHFHNSILDTLSDSALLKTGSGDIAFTTDSYVIDPIFFPGGDIGKLAVCGTVNDLSVAGAKPMFLSAGFIIEEGFPIDDLDRVVSSMAQSALEANVRIVTGDTKVVKKGQCDKVFINTAGIGVISEGYTPKQPEAGDKIIVNGFLGDHEIAILATRENLSFENLLVSDVAPLNHMISAIHETGIKTGFMRDITRGGIASILAELVENKKFGLRVEEALIPVRDEVNGLCELYGFDPLYLANEGKVLMVVGEEYANEVIEIMHSFETGRNAVVIGQVVESHAGKVLMQTNTGSSRIITKLAGEQLPRIC